MGQYSPALATGLAVTAVLLGLTQVDAPASSSTGQVTASLAADAPRPAARVEQLIHVSAAPATRKIVVRKAVASRATGTPCSAGLIALTFDDGPSPTVTPKLVRKLVELKVPATFFMIGSRVDAHPLVARLVQSSGFTIGNHTWSHPQLTHLSNPEIRDQLRATTEAFKRHFITPTGLMRPPYGDINDRVRHVIHDLGLVPVLWTIDSRDWAGGDSIQIAHRILIALRSHRVNLVLQHDGVKNSPASLGAVPIVVRKARERGYCFTHLSPTGGVGGAALPTSKARVMAKHRAARNPTTLRQVQASTAVRRLAYLDTLLRKLPLQH